MQIKLRLSQKSFFAKKLAFIHICVLCIQAQVCFNGLHYKAAIQIIQMIALNLHVIPSLMSIHLDQVKRAMNWRQMMCTLINCAIFFLKDNTFFIMPLFLKSILHVLIETCKTHQILHDEKKKNLKISAQNCTWFLQVWAHTPGGLVMRWAQMHCRRMDSHNSIIWKKSL